MKHLPDRRVVLLIVAASLTAVAASQAQRPAVQIVSPDNGAAVEGRNVVVEMRVQGVELTPRRASNGAYLLLRIDDAPPVKSFTSKFTFQDVQAGNHLLRCELRRSDGSAFDPPVRTQVRFTVRPPAR